MARGRRRVWLTVLRRAAPDLLRAARRCCQALRRRPAPWETAQRRRWWRSKLRPSPNDDRFELVCPFHRGDLLLAIQVARYAVAAGLRIRLHTATDLMPWAQDIGGGLDIEPVPVPLASAEDTPAQLAAAYLHVLRRADASPRLARCHPPRSLSEMNMHLLGYMLQQLGLPPDARLPNLRPGIQPEQQQHARTLLRPYGSNRIFLHPVGGWRLKSLPRPVLHDIADRARAAGFVLIQVGGPNDPVSDVCDGAILADFLPSQWCAIFALGNALIGVDSWTAHLAAMLDLPQVTLYGSTHPRHVNTKAWFQEQSREALSCGPYVTCSPCDSLRCLVYPDRADCTGYGIDARRLDEFLRQHRRP